MSFESQYATSYYGFRIPSYGMASFSLKTHISITASVQCSLCSRSL